MTVQTRPETTWDAAIAAFDSGAGAGGPVWLRALREQGAARFRETGFPTVRDEEWRFTNVRPIADGTFTPAPAGEPTLEAAALAPFDLPGLEGPCLVFVDGRFAPALSRIGELPKGLTVSTLADAIDRDPESVRAHLGRLAKPDGEPFTALNSALFEDGVFVKMAKGSRSSVPVRALFVSTNGPEPRVASPRNLFVVEESAEATLVEDWVSLGEGVAFTNAVTEVVVGANARAHHYVLERENVESFAVTTVHAEQGRDAFFGSHSALLGGAIVRNNVYPTLAGEGCDGLLNGFYVPQGTQHHDTHMIVQHAAPHGDSRQFYRGILDDRAHAVFSGRIIVHEDAQKTDAKQTDMNLLLSNDAVIDTKPQLEIYADDVKCTHGATIGRLDADAVFYLKARGIPEIQARGLLIYAFVNEVLERMELEPVRRVLADLLAERLPGTGS